MICPKCNNPSPDGARFCPQCGGPLLTEPPTPRVVKARKRDKHLGLRLFIWGVFLCFWAFMVLGMLFEPAPIEVPVILFVFGLPIVLRFIALLRKAARAKYSRNMKKKPWPLLLLVLVYFWISAYSVLNYEPSPETPPAHLHFFVEEVVTEPSCTATGLSRKTCSDCGQTEEYVTGPLGHSYEYTTTQEPTDRKSVV